jgi:hypothetical protein
MDSREQMRWVKVELVDSPQTPNPGPTAPEDEERVMCLDVCFTHLDLGSSSNMMITSDMWLLTTL